MLKDTFVHISCEAYARGTALTNAGDTEKWVMGNGSGNITEDQMSVVQWK